jgi:hypothetical protein
VANAHSWQADVTFFSGDIRLAYTRSMFTRVVLAALSLLLAAFPVFGAVPARLNFAGPQKQIVLHLSRLGLANRLRTIADWYAIAVKSHRHFLVVWDVTKDCSAKYGDLFASGPEGLTVLDNNEEATSLEELSTHLQSLLTSYMVLEDNTMWAPGQSTFVLGTHVLHAEAHVLLTAYDGILAAEGDSCQDYLAEHGAFLHQLQPNAEAQNYVEHIYHTYFGDSIMAGVHYRTHDPTQDWAVVPPLLGDPTDKVFGQGATVQDFVTHMRRIAQSVGAERQQQRETEISTTGPEGPQTRSKQVRFFIASNSDQAKQELAQHFPSAIFLGGEHRRDTVQGMQLALVEWLLLSRCALLLHTYGSTFAEQAALRGSYVPLHKNHQSSHFSQDKDQTSYIDSQQDTHYQTYPQHEAQLTEELDNGAEVPPLPQHVHQDTQSESTTATYHYQPPIVGIWEGRLVHHTSSVLPYCGSQQFARAYSNDRRTAKYATGANTDHSEV